MDNLKTLMLLAGGGLPGIEVNFGASRAVIERLGMPFKFYGTSGGAIVGATLASVGPIADDERIEEIHQHLLSLSTNDLIKRRWQRWLAPLAIKYRLSSQPIQKQLEILLPPDFSDLPIPFACVASDTGKKRGVTLSDGDLREAVLASMSIGGLWDYVERDGAYLSDGGTFANLPVPTVADMLEADKIIAIIPHEPARFDETASWINRLRFNAPLTLELQSERSLTYMRSVLETARGHADDLILMQPPLDGAVLSFSDGHRFIRDAYQWSTEELRKNGL